MLSILKNSRSRVQLFLYVTVKIFIISNILDPVITKKNSHSRVRVFENLPQTRPVDIPIKDSPHSCVYAFVDMSDLLCLSYHIHAFVDMSDLLCLSYHKGNKLIIVDVIFQTYNGCNLQPCPLNYLHISIHTLFCVSIYPLKY